MPRGEEDLLGEGRPDQVHQLLHALVPVAEPKPHRRNAELRTVRGDAQVAAHRDGHAAADAIPVDHRNRRLGAFDKPAARRLERPVVVRIALRRRPRLFELRDIRAGNEGRSPAPCSTITRTAGSLSNRSRMVGIASHISSDTALRRAGLLKVIQPIGPSMRASILSVGRLIMAGHRSWAAPSGLRNARDAARIDLQPDALVGRRTLSAARR